MEPRLSIVTLGVADLARAVAFYRDGLGLAMAGDGEGIAFFDLEGVRLALYPRAALAEDAIVIDPGPSAFSGVTLAHNLRSKADVDAFFAELTGIGAHIVKTPRDVFWGGYSGYFADPDGYLWEVAWNPHLAIEAPAPTRGSEEVEA
jgi:catechol 2,3-dioxygenase-like lactoylglutathione lyase family enzyme